MIFGLTLLGLGLVALLVSGRRARPATIAAGGPLAAAALLDATGLLGLPHVGAALQQVELLDLAGSNPGRRAVLLGGLVWCGPAADLVVRTVLRATSLPAPEDATAAGIRAGRWIGRLERWLLLLVVAGGQPALAIIPTGGKALLRYAEAVADARAGRTRLLVPGERDGPGRDVFLDYVLVGSLASWTQGVALGLLVAG